MAVVAVGGLLVFPLFTDPFEAMFMEFGAGDSLPGLTRLALQPWFAPALAVLPLVGLGAALVPRFSRLVRRVLIVAGFFAAVVLLAAGVIALYLPLHQLASGVRA